MLSAPTLQDTTEGSVPVPAGEAGEATEEQMYLEEVIQCAYEVNRAIRGCIGQDPGVPFRGAKPEKKASLRKAVRYAWAHELSPSDEASHNQWTYAKLREGWKWGEVEDQENKIHPNLVPYSELSWKEHLKDRLFRAIVNTTRPRN